MSQSEHPIPVRLRARSGANRVRALAMMAALLCAPPALAETYVLPSFVSQTTSGQQGVLHILNLSDESGSVEIHAIDDSGVRSGPATLALEALAAVELNSGDLGSGSADKGLAGGLGPLAGSVRLEFDTDLRIQFLARLRSADGMPAAIHDVARLEPVEVEGGFEYIVPIFHPASNMAHASRLRLINPTEALAAVEITGRDDTGATATGGSVRLSLPVGGAATLTAQQLEAGDASITGQLGAGSGSWRLRVSSDHAIRVVNLMVASTGRLDNLSTTGYVGTAPSDHAAFAARFVGKSIMAEAGSRRITLGIDSGEGFTEAVVEKGGVTSSRTGNYAYARITEDAGRVTQSYDDGDSCVLNLYFTSAMGGWYAFRCVDAGNPDGYWDGGTWSVANDTEPPPVEDASPSFPSTGAPGDQTYTAGTAIEALALPTATGGDGMLTYSLTPGIPGLTFDAAARQLAGTPTAAGTHMMTYTVTDADGDTDTLSFMITIQEAGDGTTAGDCQVGQQVPPGGSCTYPGTDDEFTVDADGRGRFLVISSTRAINVNNVTFNGRFYDFRASHQGDGVWRIDRIDGTTMPPTGGGGMQPENAVPSYAADAGPGEQTYTVNLAIAALTLPDASGGDGTLAYSLSPEVPGLTFNATTRRLSGTPSMAGTYAMTYTVTDADGDSETLSFTITVQTPSSGESWDGLGIRYEAGDSIAEMPASRWQRFKYFDSTTVEGYRYVCWNTAGCEVRNQQVLSGTIIQLSMASTSLVDEFPGSRLLHVYGDNVVVMHVNEDVSTYGLDFRAYARDFFTWFEDEFDYLLFLSNLSSYEESRGFGYAGVHISVMNDTDGLGRSKHFDSDFGSAGRLRSVIHLVRDIGLRHGPSLHELQHAWANFAVPTSSGAHWGFSSANGQIGGFDMNRLVDLGGGRWSAGVFAVNGNGHRGEPVPYSPIELYFAGLAGAEEVPDLWVAEEGEWLLDETGEPVRDDDNNRVFRADNPRTITIDEIIRENGERNPSMVERRHQRAAVILLTDDDRPTSEGALEIASQHATWLGMQSDNGGSVANYHAATGGRGTLTLDGLSEFRKSSAAAPENLPDSFGAPPRPHATRLDGSCIPL